MIKSTTGCKTFTIPSSKGPTNFSRRAKQISRIILNSFSNAGTNLSLVLVNEFAIDSVNLMAISIPVCTKISAFSITDFANSVNNRTAAENNCGIASAIPFKKLVINSTPALTISGNSSASPCKKFLTICTPATTIDGPLAANVCIATSRPSTIPLNAPGATFANVANAVANARKPRPAIRIDEAARTLDTPKLRRAPDKAAKPPDSGPAKAAAPSNIAKLPASASNPTPTATRLSVDNM